MATKKITKKAAPKKKAPAKKAAPKKAPKEKTDAPAGKAAPRHPKASVLELHGGKEALAKALAASLARDDEDTDVIETRLKTASNGQLLRLQRVVTAVKAKWGSREALIEALGNVEKKSKDKDYLAKLATFPLPKLYDLATSAERRARA